MRFAKVKDIMTKNPLSINSKGVLSEVVDLLKTHTFHHVPVTDDDNRLVGMISETDLDRMQSGATLFKNPNKTQYDNAIYKTKWIRDSMTTDVTSINPEESIEKAYHYFKENLFRALPVVEDDLLVGIVTPLDLLGHFFEKTGNITNG